MEKKEKQLTALPQSLPIIQKTGQIRLFILIYFINKSTAFDDCCKALAKYSVPCLNRARETMNLSIINYFLNESLKTSTHFITNSIVSRRIRILLNFIVSRRVKFILRHIFARFRGQYALLNTQKHHRNTDHPLSPLSPHYRSIISFAIRSN